MSRQSQQLFERVAMTHAVSHALTCFSQWTENRHKQIQYGMSNLLIIRKTWSYWEVSLVLPSSHFWQVRKLTWMPPCKVSPSNLLVEQQKMTGAWWARVYRGEESFPSLIKYARIKIVTQGKTFDASLQREGQRMIEHIWYPGTRHIEIVHEPSRKECQNACSV